MNPKTALLFILACLLASFLAGCGQGNSPIVTDPESTNKAVLMRDLYTKANGNYDSLTADQKAQFAKAIAPGMSPEKVWTDLAPHKADRR